jgi:magnesium chelatase family protein
MATVVSNIGLGGIEGYKVKVEVQLLPGIEGVSIFGPPDDAAFFGVLSLDGSVKPVDGMYQRLLLQKRKDSTVISPCESPSSDSSHRWHGVLLC